MVTSINKEALWMHTVNHLTRNKMDQKKKILSSPITAKRVRNILTLL